MLLFSLNTQEIIKIGHDYVTTITTTIFSVAVKQEKEKLDTTKIRLLSFYFLFLSYILLFRSYNFLEILMFHCVVCFV